MKIDFKQWLPHVGAFFILMAVSFIYFAPYVFQGKVLQQSDNLQSRGMQTEARAYEDKGQPTPLWTNSMFSGMPNYQIHYNSKNPIQFPFRGMLLGNHMAPPHTGFFLVLFGTYLCLVLLRVDWRIALVGALGFGFMAHFMQLFEAGHSTKIIALGYTGLIISGIITAFRGRFLLGASLTAFFLAMQIYANHVQITYYTLITGAIFGIAYLIHNFKTGQIDKTWKPALLLVAAVVLGFLTNTGRLWTTYEYSQETIRGKSELLNKTSESSGSVAGEGGLSKSYAFQWSYGKMETFNLLVPNFMGGASRDNFLQDQSSATFKAIRSIDPQQAQSLAQSGITTHYWGDQPFTSGAVYLGVILVFLAILGMFLLNGPIKWASLIAIVLTILLSWGDSFKAFNYFIFDYFPMYNKFRAVNMALTITMFFTAFLAALGLNAFFKESASERKLKGLIGAASITGGLLVIAILLSFGMLSFEAPSASARIPAQLQGGYQALLGALAEDRAGLLRADAFRGLLFLLLGAGVLYANLKGFLKNGIAIIAILVLSSIDLIGIAKRSLSNDDYVEKRAMRQATVPAPVDEQIMKDPDPHYRVADFRSNPFSNAMTSYFHKSAGGYHAAKLMNYQEMIEKYLGDPMGNRKIYGMLNAKYFINQEGKPSQNPDALGNAWFVNEVKVVNTQDDAYNQLGNIDPATTALVSKSYAKGFEGWSPQNTDQATIALTSYHPDTLRYTYSASSDQFALFSEVYYPESKGWSMYLNGEPFDGYTKANFLLRAARLPAGTNQQLTMIFAPKSYYQGELIGSIIGLLTIVFFFGATFLYLREEGLPPATVVANNDDKVSTRKPTTATAARANKKRK